MHSAQKSLGPKTTVSYLLTIVYDKTALCTLCSLFTVMHVRNQDVKEPTPGTARSPLKQLYTSAALLSRGRAEFPWRRFRRCGWGLLAVAAAAQLPVELMKKCYAKRGMLDLIIIGRIPFSPPAHPLSPPGVRGLLCGGRQRSDRENSKEYVRASLKFHRVLEIPSS